MSLLRVNEVQDLDGNVILKVTDQVSSSLTINVPADYPTISAALDAVRTKRILNESTITVKVADGTYTISAAINCNHPQGGQIRVIGNQTTPANCVITCADSYTGDGFVCSGGNVLSMLDGFTVTRPNKAEMPINTTGVLAVQNSTIICGANMRVSKWFYGIAARDSSYVFCPGAIVDQAGDVGIWAFCGSTIVCNGATSTNAAAAGNPWGFGFQAEFGSTLVGTGITASGNKIGGVASLSNSICRVPDAVSNNNVGSGFFVSGQGVIEVGGTVSSANNNTRYGVEVVDGQGQVINVITITGNTLGATNPFAFFSNVAGQGRIATSTGPLRLDTSDTSGTFFNTSGGLQFEVRSTANSVNRAYAQGAALGVAPQIGVAGSDTNIDIQLTPKGTGAVRYGTFTANADAPITGYITIKDAAGNLRKLAVIA